MAGFIHVSERVGCSVPSWPFDVMVKEITTALADAYPEIRTAIRRPLEEGFDILSLKSLDTLSFKRVALAVTQAHENVRSKAALSVAEQRALEHWPEVLAAIAADPRVKEE